MQIALLFVWLQLPLCQHWAVVLWYLQRFERLGLALNREVDLAALQIHRQ